MTKRRLLFFGLLLTVLPLAAQIDLKIYELPRNQHKATNSVRLSGVVTAIVGDGFFVQDKIGDGDPTTCDAIFVATDTAAIRLGDELTLTGRCTADTLTAVASLKKIAEQQSVSATKVVFPDDFLNGNGSKYIGMAVEFDQTLVVTNNYYWNSGTITLSSQRLMTPTEVALPGSSDYQAVLQANAKDNLIVAPKTVQSRPFADADSTLRTGYQVDNLTGTLITSSGNYHKLQITATPDWYANERPTTHADLGDYNVKVCATNLEYYLRSDYGTGYGPDDEAAANRQHAKIVKGLRAIDADIYGLLEIQQGQNAIAYLCDALNQAAGSDIYAYIDDGTSVYTTYTKTAFIYRKDKIALKGAFQFNNQKTLYRKAIQGFTLKANGESFVLSLNHFKSKSGTTTDESDKDQNDGQGQFNGTRVAEAESVIAKCAEQTTDSDVLVMGDLNAHSMEDPVQRFVAAGYKNLLKKYATNQYSYVFGGRCGLLDHALANASMSAQITGATVVHLNADEPAIFEYPTDLTTTMYRYSDHDAVVVGLSLGTYHDDVALDAPETDGVFVSPTTHDGWFEICNATGQTAYIYDLGGRPLHTETITNDCQSFHAATLATTSGLLLVRLQSNGKSAIFKVVKF